MPVVNVVQPVLNPRPALHRRAHGLVAGQALQPQQPGTGGSRRRPHTPGRSAEGRVAHLSSQGAHRRRTARPRLPAQAPTRCVHEGAAFRGPCETLGIANGVSYFGLVRAVTARGTGDDRLSQGPRRTPEYGTYFALDNGARPRAAGVRTDWVGGWGTAAQSGCTVQVPLSDPLSDCLYTQLAHDEQGFSRAGFVQLLSNHGVLQDGTGWYEPDWTTL